jgi:hypothetical protein
VPAAAVIPAPIAYIKIVAVKKLVVGSAAFGSRSHRYGVLGVRAYLSDIRRLLFTGRRRDRKVYFEKIRVLKASVSLE